MTSVQAHQNDTDSTFVLGDGTVVTIRKLRAEDREALKEFINGLSEETIYFRFLESGVGREVLLDELCCKPERRTLVAVIDNRIVAHAAYYRSGKRSGGDWANCSR